MLRDMIVDYLGDRGYKIYNHANESISRGSVVVGSGGDSWKRTTHTIIVYFNNEWVMDITCEGANAELRYLSKLRRRWRSPGTITGIISDIIYATHKIDFHSPDAFDQLDKMLWKILSI